MFSVFVEKEEVENVPVCIMIIQTTVKKFRVPFDEIF